MAPPRRAQRHSSGRSVELLRETIPGFYWQHWQRRPRHHIPFNPRHIATNQVVKSSVTLQSMRLSEMKARLVNMGGTLQRIKEQLEMIQYESDLLTYELSKKVEVEGRDNSVNITCRCSRTYYLSIQGNQCVCQPSGVAILTMHFLAGEGQINMTCPCMEEYRFVYSDQVWHYAV